MAITNDFEDFLTDTSPDDLAFGITGGASLASIGGPLALLGFDKFINASPAVQRSTASSALAGAAAGAPAGPGGVVAGGIIGGLIGFSLGESVEEEEQRALREQEGIQQRKQFVQSQQRAQRFRLLAGSPRFNERGNAPPPAPLLPAADGVGSKTSGTF